MPPLKTWLRRCVVWSAVGPLRWLYLRLYYAAAGVLAWLLAREPGVLAVYLRRGAAKGDLLPGVSDLDFAVITDSRAGMPVAHRRPARFHTRRGWWAGLARVANLVDPALQGWRADELAQWHAMDLVTGFRFFEGQATWRRYSGRDYVADLPPEPPDWARARLYAEVVEWWQRWVDRTMVHLPAEIEPINATSSCYKTIAEVVRMRVALHTDVDPNLRREALLAAPPHLRGDQLAFIERLEAHARRRFLAHDAALAEDAHRFFLGYMDELLAAMSAAGLGAITRLEPLHIDAPAEEWPLAAGDRAYAEALAARLERGWGFAFRGLYLTPMYCCLPQDAALLVEVDPARPPSLEQLIALRREHAAAQSEQAHRLQLHLLTPHAAYHLGPDAVRDYWQMAATPFSAPELFAMLRRPECSLRGAGWQGEAPLGHTLLVGQMLWCDKLRRRRQLEDPPRDGWGAREIATTFWRWARLEAMERLLERGELRYCLTLPAVARALDAAGVPLPTVLADRSRGPAIHTDAPCEAMLQYAREVDPSGAVFRQPTPLTPTPGSSAIRLGAAG